jgi:aminopeptidase-like protein
VKLFERAKVLVEELYPFDYSIVGIGNDEAAKVLCKILPFNVIEFASGQELNGWKIPRGWKLNFFKLSQNGITIIQSSGDSFLVAKNCKSVTTQDLTYEELLSHVNRSQSGGQHDQVYDWRNLYSNYSNDWSISLSEHTIAKLDHSAIFSVEIRVAFYDGTMKVLEYNTHPNAEKTILLNAHNCHPYQANDDVSGIVAAILCAESWNKNESAIINLRLIIAPELYGPIFYLNQFHNDSQIASILFKAVGNKGLLKLQKSLRESAQISKIAEKLFQELNLADGIYPYREIYGNDEIVFENPPFNIPSITLTRFPFLNYHNSSDTPSTLDPLSIVDTTSMALDIISCLNSMSKYEWVPRGLVKLSDLSANLYKPTPAPGIHNRGASEVEQRWHLLMNSLPGLINEDFDALDFSVKFDLPLLEVMEYLSHWENSQLIRKSKNAD